MADRKPFATVGVGDYLEGLSGNPRPSDRDSYLVDQVIAPKLGMLWFESALEVTLPASASKFTVVEEEIPHGTLAVLRFIGHQLVNPAGWSDITWDIERNNGIIHPWDNIEMQLATLQNPRAVFHVLKGPDKIRWTATNQTVAAIPDVAALLGGWFWPQPEG